MTIPANLTHAEVGAFLMAVGQHMIDHDVCAEAVVQPEDVRDNLPYAENLAHSMIDAYIYLPMHPGRALEILQSLTLEEAIAFVQLPKGL
jgi:hypothetical protein